ncbi:hypothetical protein GCM10009776_08270 [Microbacterium deminutum]|uniref:DUF2510 domain-containing protein n=1 Tax=Microbacterium deminutum TaxID=344164 RepID=A0ABN2QDX7_9MICO
MGMPNMDEASQNILAAREAANSGNLSGAFGILLHGQQGAASPGDGNSAPTSSGDSYPYVGQTSSGDPYYPYVPPTTDPYYPEVPPPPAFVVQPGWYADPFDGVGYRWWNGSGWTQATSG